MKYRSIGCHYCGTPVGPERRRHWAHHLRCPKITFFAWLDRFITQAPLPVHFFVLFLTGMAGMATAFGLAAGAKEILLLAGFGR